VKLLTFSDLHLGDYRNTPEYEKCQLECIRELAAKIKPDLLINVGDTVSKDAYLRDSNERMNYWEQYVNFKRSFCCPVIETCLARERTFFADLFNTECEFSLIENDIGFISFDPLEYDDHSMVPEQIQWLTTEIKKLAGKTIVFTSHVPIAQTTLTREVREGMYLTQSDLIKELAAEYADFAIFLAGHFHVPPELPRSNERELMLMAGCFAFCLAENHSTYLRIIDISDRNITIHTINDSMQEILPAFNLVDIGRNIV